MTEWIIAIGVGVGITAVIAVFLRRARRRHRRAIASFENGPRMSESQYLAALDIDPASDRAKIAIWLRNLIAEYGQISADAVLPSHRIWTAYKDLPFYDNQDIADFIFRLEKGLCISIDAVSIEKVFPKDIEPTVKDMTLNLIELVKVFRDGKKCGYNKPGYSALTVGILFCIAAFLVVLLNLVFGIISRFTENCRLICVGLTWIFWGLIILGGACFVSAVIGMITASHRDRKANRRCDDCGGLLRHVNTYGSDAPGQRWDGRGFYCAKCGELKQNQSPEYE